MMEKKAEVVMRRYRVYSSYSLLLMLVLAGCQAASAGQQSRTGAGPMLEETSRTISMPGKGVLGRGFGKVVRVSGTMLGGQGSKGDLGQTLMRIETVAGQALSQPVVLPLQFFAFSRPELPSPGARASFIGYETGAYEGIPEEAFKYLPRVASEDFHFASAFQVCK